MATGLLTPISGGFRLRETERFYVDVHEMVTNWRVVLTEKTAELEQGIYAGWYRAWCYPASGGLLAAVAAGQVFDPDAGEEPTGWVKEAGTERRACKGYIVGPREHDTYVAGCPACGDESLYR